MTSIKSKLLAQISKASSEPEFLTPESKKVNQLIAKISTSKRHISEIIKQLSQVNGKQQVELGRTLAKCYAAKVPAKLTKENAIKLTLNACKSLKEDEVTEIIEREVSHRANTVKRRNKLEQHEDITQMLCDEKSPDDVAQIIYDQSIHYWTKHNEFRKYVEKRIYKDRHCVSVEKLYLDEHPEFKMVNLKHGCKVKLKDQYNHDELLEIKEEKNPLYFENPQHVFFDTRGMGAGKTKMQASLVEKIKQVFGSSISIMYMTHRMGLSKGAAEQFQITDYQDVSFEEYGSVYHVATCVNSANKFKQQFNVLIIDEARQTVETLFDSSLIKGRASIVADFEKKFREADLVIVADADLNDFTVNYLKDLGSNKKLTILENTPKPHEATHTLLDSHDHARKHLLNLLDQGKRGTIACTSELEARKTVKFLEKSGIKKSSMLLLTGENKGDTKQAAWLLKPTEESKNYDLVIYTPVIGSGVSIEYDKFEFAFLLSTSVLPANEASQMWGRNRYAKEKFLSFGISQNYQKVTDIDAICEADLDALRLLADNFMIELPFNYLTGDRSFTPSKLSRLRAKIISDRNSDSNDYENNFVFLMELNGIRLENLSSPENIKFKTLKTETIEEIVQNRFNADVISKKAADSLIEQTTALTQAQSDSIRRAFTVDMAGTEEITEDDVKYELEGGLSVVKNYEFLQIPKQLLLDIDSKNAETKDKIGSQLLLQKIVVDVLSQLKDKNVDYQTALEACMILKKNHKQLSNFSDYNKSKSEFKRPVSTVQNFLRKFGYDLVKIGKNSGGKSGEIFELKVIDQISLYTSRRAALKE